MLFGGKDIINRWRFRRDVLRISDRDFSIISSNCVGGRIYETLGLHYLSPTVGLYFYPACFVKFAMNLKYYLTIKPKLILNSRYRQNATYPIAELDDLEIHFLHYHNGKEAINKWLRKSDRVNLNNIFVPMTDRDGFTRSSAAAFDLIPFRNKVLFAANDWPCSSTILFPKFRNQKCVGDLYSNYQYFPGIFSFSDWIGMAEKIQDFGE